ncbi:MAG: short-chain dehydrogenase [Acidobacteria bacterium]|nr:short-chain dehydrogenase [Acidobacteriota bacterium]|tara:strand:+ start:1738 stop:2520 length:783 start_codon:yes stop_codon:yes gene_type:complete
MELKDRIVVVTGGALGIGRALVRRFASEGARHVVVVDIDGDGARDVAAEVGGTAITADVGHGPDMSRVVHQIEDEVGSIDLFCSNAGLFVPGDAEVSDELWEASWRVNVLAHVHMARTLVPRMLERGRGYLLQTASAAGLLSQIGSAPYSTTKHAAVGFAEWLAITYGERGLRVSVLCPQAVRTRMTEGVEVGTVSAVDGMLEPDVVAAAVVRGLEEERFLILPHPQVEEYMRRKAADYDRWLRGMRKLKQRFPDVSGDG